MNLEEIREGDVLVCKKGDWHFQTGDPYTVHRDNLTYELVIWCDEIQVHYVRTLNPKQWERRGNKNES